MGLGGTLANALSGLKVTQAGLDVVSRNVSNSSTVGYSKQTLNQSASNYGGAGFGVRVGEVQRVLNQHLVSQLRGELTGAGYADTMQSYLERLEISFGAPGAANGIESLYSEFQASLEGIIASPENPSTRAEFVQNAKLLAGGLNSMTSDVQELRRQAETEIDSSVGRINELLDGIASANRKIAVAPVDDPQVLDQRDALINELSGYMDVNVLPAAKDGTVSVLSRSGTLLVSDVPMKLTFENRQATVGPNSIYEQGGLGTIVLSGPGRPPVDLIEEGAFRSSGKIGALIELRDNTLVEAQNSLDALADSMARAMSSYDMESKPVAGGRSLDLDALQYGDEINFSYTDAGGSRSVTIVKQNASIDSLPPGAVGIDFGSGNMAALTAEFASRGFALAKNATTGDYEVTAIAAPSVVDGLSAKATATDPAGGQLAIPLFTDGGNPYVGNHDGGRQQRGFAGSIRVNQAILDDTTVLSKYGADVPLGDPARPQEMLSRLQAAEIRTPNGRINAADPTKKADLGTFVSRIISTQAARASAANHRQEAQAQVVGQLEERAAAKSGVSVDEEMTKLLELQMAYQANAKVVQTFEEMLYKLLEL